MFFGIHRLVLSLAMRQIYIIFFDNFVSVVLPFPNDHLLLALRLHLRPRDHHHPQHDPRRRQVPRHAQQRQGVHGPQRGDDHKISAKSCWLL